ncbi:MAG TPA: ATP-binding cassette domain-containing protein [Rugosimonospora sp.]
MAEISLRVETGAVHGLLGPNGAGKTTLLGALLGLIRPDEGEMLVFGRPATGGVAPAGVAGFVDSPRLYPYLSARRNLQLLAHLDGDGAAARIDQVLHRVGLESRADVKVGGFSLGMRQRLGIAAALLADPLLLVLDEPTNGLDPAGMRDIRALITDLATNGRTVLVSSHQMPEIEAMCSAVTVLRDGEVAFDGALSQMRSLAPEPSYLLSTSDDRAALELGATRTPIAVDRDAHSDGLIVRGSRTAMHEYMISLGKADIAVEHLQLQETSLESMFLRLTDDRAAATGAPDKEAVSS